MATEKSYRVKNRPKFNHKSRPGYVCNLILSTYFETLVQYKRLAVKQERFWVTHPQMFLVWNERLQSLSLANSSYKRFIKTIRVSNANASPREFQASIYVVLAYYQMCCKLRCHSCCE